MTEGLTREMPSTVGIGTPVEPYSVTGESVCVCVRERERERGLLGVYYTTMGVTDC